MRKKLTAAALESGNLPEGEYWDSYCPGLILRVGKLRMTWQFRYRQGGKNPRERIGYFPALSLSDARKMAADIGKRIDAGLRAVPEPVVHPRSPEAMTLAKLIDDYEKMRRTEGGRIKSLDEAMRTVRRGLKKHLKLPVRDFTKADLRAARDAIGTGNSHMSNRFLGYLSPVMTWAVSEDLMEYNFVGQIRRAAEAKRDRVLSRKELKSIWLATYELGDSIPAKNFGRMVRFLIATGQRIGEAANMKHGDVLDGLWKQSDNKASREHRLKLPQIALDQIDPGAAKDLVFPGERGTKIGAVSKLKAALDEVSGVSDWRIHDIRRTAASLMQEAGVSETSIRAVLNHAISGVGQVYLRGELDKQKADALKEWGKELEKIVGIKRAA